MRIRRAVGLGVVTGLAGALTGPCAAALATTPAPGTTSLPTPSPTPTSPAGVRLVTAIAVVDRSSDGMNAITRYTVTVGAEGGTAHDTELEVATEQPAQWRSYVGACKPLGPTGLRLLCDLGEVTAPASVQMTAATPGVAAAEPSVVAVAGAANAQSQEVAGAALPVKAAPAPSAEPESPQPERPQKVLPAPEPRLPLVSTHRAVGSVIRPRRFPLAHAPSAPRSAGRVVPPVQAVPPQRQAHRQEPQQPNLPRLLQPRPFQSQPFQPLSPAPVQQPPLEQPVPLNPAVPNNGGGLLPQLTPNDGTPLLAPQSPPATDPARPGPGSADASPLSMTTSAEVPGDRASWVKVLGVLVVAEVAVLWLATSLGLWRRRSAGAAFLRASLKAAGVKATGIKSPISKSAGLRGVANLVRTPLWLTDMAERTAMIRSRLSFRR